MVLRKSGALLVLTTAGCVGSSNKAGSNTQSIGMAENLAFDPQTVRIAVGTNVVWENTSQANHTVTAYGNEIPNGAAYFASGGFDSEQAAHRNVREGLIRPDEQYEHTFERADRYGYFCIPHEQAGMTGTVVVTDTDRTGEG